MLISTFELLVKPQLPSIKILQEINPSLSSSQLEFLGGLSRTVIQGYFLTIANPSHKEISLSIVYTLKPQLPIDFEQLITFLDSAGNQQDTSANLISLGDDKYSIPALKLQPRETILLILQPNFVSFPNLTADENFEARGYAEIFLGLNTPSDQNTSVLVTPEHRGTFYADNPNQTLSAPVSLGEISYSLPVQNGGLLNLSKH